MAKDRQRSPAIPVMLVVAVAAFAGYMRDGAPTMGATLLPIGLPSVAARSGVDLELARALIKLHADRPLAQAGAAVAEVSEEPRRRLWHNIVFSGEKSRTADTQALARAKEMDGKADPTVIWKETGWRKDKAGSWVYEISDKDAKITGMPDLANVRPGEAITVRLGALVDHPLLFKAYPELANIKVKVFNGALVKNDDDPKAEYVATTTPAEDGEPATIEIAARICDFLSTLVHEVQHLVEDYGDLDYGPETGSYDLNIGEARARNTERRLRLGDDLRRRRPPGTTCDVPRQLIQVSPK